MNETEKNEVVEKLNAKYITHEVKTSWQDPNGERATDPSYTVIARLFPDYDSDDDRQAERQYVVDVVDIMATGNFWIRGDDYLGSVIVRY